MFSVEVIPPAQHCVGSSDESDRPANESFYTVAGRSLCVRTRDEWSARLFDGHFSNWHFSPRDAPRQTPTDALIVVPNDPEPPPVPAGFTSFEVALGGRCHTDGQTYFFEICGSLIRVGTQAPPLVEIWVGEHAQARTTSALARLVFNAASAALRRCGLFELHGGGVVEPSGAGGVLFVGPSGSGKSTLTMQLAAAGWRYLSDDTLLICSGERGAEAWALRRAFAVTEPTIAASRLPRLDSLATSPVPFDPLKRRFEPEALFPGGFVGSCAPRAIIFPVVTHEGSTRAGRLSQSATMARLLKMCPWSCYDRPAAREHLEVLSRLARQCAAFDLFAGRDLMDDAGRAPALAAALLRGETV